MVMKMGRAAAWMGVLGVAVTTGLVGCNVESTDQATGGVKRVDGGPENGCPSGVTVVLSDYVSTQIALSDLDGKTQSASFLSTASSETNGLAFALSGDVVVPSTTPASGQIVLLDRYGTNVITWADPETAEVTAQLEVGTGFESNPQDYLELDGELALVTRFGSNADPDQQDFDGGNDVLVLDLSTPTKPKIKARIALPDDDDLPARPGRMIRVGDEVILPLERISDDYSTTGDAMLVGISVAKQKVAWTQTLEGLKNCGRPSLSPDGKRLAVACSGTLDPVGNGTLDESALVFFAAEPGPLEEVDRISAEDLVGEPIQSRAVYAGGDVLLFQTQSAWGGETNNRVLSYDLETGKTQDLIEASPDADGLGKGLVYSGITCAPGCSDTCLLADADEGVLQRFQIIDGKVEVLDPITVEKKVGLPPTGIGLR